MDECNSINITTKSKKQYEYIHEVKGKWTIFNKHAIEIEQEPDPNEKSGRGCVCKEDSIIETLI